MSNPCLQSDTSNRFRDFTLLVALVALEENLDFPFSLKCGLDTRRKPFVASFANSDYQGRFSLFDAKTLHSHGLFVPESLSKDRSKGIKSIARRDFGM